MKQVQDNSLSGNRQNPHDEVFDLESELDKLTKEFGDEHAAVVDCLKRLASSIINHADELSYEEAVPLYNRSLSIYERMHDNTDLEISIVLAKLADCYEVNDDYASGELYRRQVLSILENCNEASDDTIAWHALQLGSNLQSQCKMEAEFFYKLAVEIGERSKPGTIKIGYRETLGDFYDDFCEYDKAETVFRRICKFGNNYKHKLAITLCHMGRYSEAEEILVTILANKEKNIDELKHDIAIPELFNAMAILYEYTGRYEESENYHRRCYGFHLKEDGADNEDTAFSLMNIAWTIHKAGRNQEAEKLCAEVLGVLENLTPPCSQSLLANAISNHAIVLAKCKRYVEALAQQKRALELRERYFPADHSNHVLESVREMASLLAEMGKYNEAEEYYFRALKICGHIYEGKFHPDFSDTLHGIARLCRAINRKSAAIFWAKKAVNVIQKIREDISDIKSDALRAYDNSVSSIYRQLSDWLIDDGRLFEAQHVLSLLKEQECFEFVRRDASSASHVSEGLSYTEQEAAQAVLYQSALQPLAELKSEQEALLANKQRTVTEEMRLTELEDALEKAGADFYAALAKISEQLGFAREEKVVEVQEAEGLMQDISELGDHTVAIFTVCCESCLHTILITPTFRKSFSYPIGEKELNKKIFELRAALLPTNGKFYDPQPFAEELYSIIVAPLVGELKTLNTTTILWSMDGVLRYIPMNTLHDGQRYLVESFCNVIITPASRGRLLSATKKQWTGAGFGVTQAHESFKSLPAVQKELSGIIRNPGNLNAVLEGTLRLDADFNWVTMKQDLAEHHPAVHIASHFRLSPCNDIESYLLLGDGQKLTLDRLRNQQNIFSGVDLLTLSACDTAVGSGTGKELDGFSMIAQRQGAKSVIASLWAVEDSSTSTLMQEFYRLRESGITKGEALRRVQVKMLNGEIGVNANSVSRGESLFRYENNPDSPYSHPYFWAPFVLIGNYL